MRKNKYGWLAAITLAFVANCAVSSFAQQSLLHILSPSQGQVVRPGQTIAISVAADSSVQKLALVGQQPLGMARVITAAGTDRLARGQGEAHPIQFQLTIPAATQPGMYHLTAVGKIDAGSVESDALIIDVEKSEEPTRIWAEPSTLQFIHIGDQIPLRALGSFADGSQSELTRSGKTKFTSADPRVVSITADGLVTAIGQGRTSVRVQTLSADYSIPASVQDGK